ncbi:Ig-like domain-containing protein, partial [Avibacterium sp. 20-129]|uniref:Ig-like domain-containing protein n=1 Tax=Avibacterium sp. 20-129 TaxID=2911525 RepID=UPI0022466E78
NTNTAPVAVDDAATGSTAKPASGNVLSNDSDVNGDKLTVTSVSVDKDGNGSLDVVKPGETVTLTKEGKTIGTVVVNADGTYTVTPAENYTGELPVITYTVSDGKGGIDEGTLTVTNGNKNTPPVAKNDIDQATTDKPAAGNVLSNDTDVNGDTLKVGSAKVDINGDGVDDPLVLGQETQIRNSNGDVIASVTVNENGTYSVTPTQNYTGALPVITYTADDNQGGTTTATLTVTNNNIPAEQHPEMNIDRSDLATEVNEGQLAANVAQHQDKGIHNDVNSTNIGIVDQGKLVFTDSDTTNYSIGKVDSASATAGKVQLTTEGLPTLFAQDGTATGAKVTWMLSDNGQTVTGKAVIGGQTVDVITVALSDVSKEGTTFTANYTTTLHHALEHSTVNGQNNLSFNVKALVSDGAEGTTSSTLNVTVWDDIPEAMDTTVLNPVNGGSPVNTNLTLVVDYSSSMNETISDTSSVSRMDMMKSVLDQLLNAYGDLGDVKVNLIVYGNGTTQLGSNWQSIDSAKAELAKSFMNIQSEDPTVINSNGTPIYNRTDMDSALKRTMTEFNESGKYDNANNVVYFITDADESASGFTPPQASTLTTWRDFLQENNVTAYGYGVSGDDTYAATFKSFGIGYDPETQSTAGMSNYYTDSNFAGLNEDMQGTVVVPMITNNLLVPENATTTYKDGAVAHFGADGGHIQSVKVGSTTVTYDSTSSSTGAHIATIKTANGGELKVNLDTGDYTYQAGSLGKAGYTEVIEFTVVDADGDEATGTQHLEIYKLDAVNDRILTNVVGNTLTLDKDVLLANDVYRGESATLQANGSSITGQTANDVTVKLWDPTNQVGQVVSYDRKLSQHENISQSIELTTFGTNSSAPSNFSQIGYTWAEVKGVFDSGIVEDDEYIKFNLQSGDDLMLYLNAAQDTSSRSVQILDTNGTTVLASDSSFNAGDSLALNDLRAGTYYVKMTGTPRAFSNPTFDLFVGVKHSEGDSFDYTLTETPDLTDTGKVMVEQVVGNTINGTGMNETLIGSDTTVALNGNGGNDVLVYNNHIQTFNGGEGIDTLLLTDVGTINLNGKSISNIETIKLGEGSQSISLTPAQVKAITDSGNTLTIYGDKDDTVTLSGFSKGATDYNTGVTAYTDGSGVTVNVDNLLVEANKVIL